MADIDITERLEKYEGLIPNEDLKKEYHEFLEKYWFKQPGKRTISEQMFFTALYFVNWQKEKNKDNEDFDIDEMIKLLESLKKHYQDLKKEASKKENYIYYSGGETSLKTAIDQINKRIEK